MTMRQQKQLIREADRLARATELRLSTSQVIDLLYELDGDAVDSLLTDKNEKNRLGSRTLAYWAKRGLLAPSGSWDSAPQNRRQGRQYTLSDLARARLIVHARAAGISMQRIQAIFANLPAAELDRAFRSKGEAWLVIEPPSAWSALLVRGKTHTERSSADRIVLSVKRAKSGNAAAAQRLFENARDGGAA
jgi:DNA-binding transcriptional MerR regulator